MAREREKPKWTLANPEGEFGDDVAELFARMLLESRRARAEQAAAESGTAAPPPEEQKP